MNSLVIKADLGSFLSYAFEMISMSKNPESSPSFCPGVFLLELINLLSVSHWRSPAIARLYQQFCKTNLIQVLSEDIFDREVEKSLGEKKSLRAFSRPDPQKRSSSSMEPDDEKQPEAKKSRTELSAPQDGN